MSSPRTSEPLVGDAEQAFREAFDRLKLGKPRVLPKGAPVTQNNVAREAGRDPTALRKSRYPALVREIQQWVADHEAALPDSAAQAKKKARAKNRNLRELLAAFKLERDTALSLLVHADAKILELTMELGRHIGLTPISTVTPITIAQTPVTRSTGTKSNRKPQVVGLDSKQ